MSKILKGILMDFVQTSLYQPVFTFLRALAFSALMFVFCERFCTLLQNQKHLSHPTLVSVF